MRYLTILGFGILTLATALAMPAPAAALQVPGGSYQQTCRGTDVRGSTLYAECQDRSGGWHRTELPDYQRCRGEIQNIDGNLQCTGGGYAGDDRGRDADRDHDRGDADRDHDRDRDHDHDADRDRDRGRDNGPRGSYSQTCQDVRVNGSTLEARCQKRNGQWKQTSLRNFDRCSGDIENNNGKLRCRR